MANYVMESALTDDEDARAKRCGVTVTNSVSEMTTLLILRFRFQIISAKAEMLAEDVASVAFRGTPSQPTWLQPDQAEALIAAVPSGNYPADLAKKFLDVVTGEMPSLTKPLRELARMRAEKVLASHRRVRKALDGSHAAREIKVQGDPDVLGLFILLPGG